MSDPGYPVSWAVNTTTCLWQFFSEAYNLDNTGPVVLLL